MVSAYDVLSICLAKFKFALATPLKKEEMIRLLSNKSVLQNLGFLQKRSISAIVRNWPHRFIS